MEITVFAKKKKTKTGKEFFTYLTTLTKKDTGEEEMIEVKFREECGVPKNCPVNLVIERSDANISKKTVIREDNGEAFERKTLWVSAWKEGEPYVDTSLDEYDL